MSNVASIVSVVNVPRAKGVACNTLLLLLLLLFLPSVIDLHKRVAAEQFLTRRLRCTECHNLLRGLCMSDATLSLPSSSFVAAAGGDGNSSHSIISSA